MESFARPMIVETIVASVTLIVMGSLWLSDRILKRQHESDEDPQVWIEPYVYPSTSVPCPKCGVTGLTNNPEWGPTRPTACKDGDGCPAYPRDHLHVSCGYCAGRWYRAPKNGT